MESNTGPDQRRMHEVPPPLVAFIITAQDRSSTLVAELSALKGLLDASSPGGILVGSCLVLANTLALEAGDAADAMR